MPTLPRSFRRPDIEVRLRQLHALVDAIPPGSLAKYDRFTLSFGSNCGCVSYLPEHAAPAEPSEIPPTERALALAMIIDQLPPDRLQALYAECPAFGAMIPQP